MKQPVKYILSFLFVFFITLSPKAETTDSLKQLLAEAKEDTVKVNLLIKLSASTIARSPETSLLYADQALALSGKINYTDGKLNALNNKGEIYSAQGDYEKALKLFYEAYALAYNSDNKIYIPKTLNQIADVYKSQGKYKEALSTLEKAEAEAIKIPNKKPLLKTINYVGGCYFDMEDYEKALNSYLRLSKLAEELSDKEAQAQALMNMGNIYMKALGDFNKSKQFYLDALKISEAINASAEIANCLTNIGASCQQLKEYDTALEYYLRSLPIKESLGNKLSTAKTLGNIGQVYYFKSDHNRALEYYNSKLKICKELSDKPRIAGTLMDIAGALVKQKKYEEAEADLNAALVLSREIRNKTLIQKAYDDLAGLYAETGKYKNAYDNYKLYSNIKDSIFSESKTKNLMELQTQFETEKKEKENELLRQKEETNNVQIKNQQILIFSSAGGIFLLLVLAVFIFRGYKQKQKANEQLAEINTELEKLSIVASETDNGVLIANGKGEIEWINPGYTRICGYELEEFKKVKGNTIFEASGNPEIAELIKESSSEKKSLNYEAINVTKDGRSIWVQSTLTPIVEQKTGKLKKIVIIDTDITRQKLAEEEIRHKNKDITDSINYAKKIQSAILPVNTYVQRGLPHSFILFKPKDIVSGDFYFYTEKDNNLIIAAADCTGHGVPGSLMSMIGHNILVEIINHGGITTPGDILTELHRRVRTTLKQDQASAELRDGMDIALCSVRRGPGNKIVVEYAGANRPLYLIRDGLLQEVKPDKNPIGGYETEQKRVFTNHLIDVEKTDTIYMFSDGYADQFGGEKKKKYMVKRLQQLLLDNHHLPMNEQKAILDKTNSEWRGELEQIDDILVIGVKFSLLGI